MILFLLCGIYFVDVLDRFLSVYLVDICRKEVTCFFFFKNIVECDVFDRVNEYN